MKAWPPWVVEAILVGVLGAALAAAEEPGGSGGGNEKSPSSGVGVTDPAPEPVQEGLSESQESPLADSVDAVVERFIRERTPCGLAGSSVPCFPTGVERESEDYSIEEALRERPDDGPPPPPSVPTAGEMIQYGANPHPVAANVGGGTDVPCKAKHLFKKLLGKDRTYYVYRVWDSTGVRGVLREEPLDPDRFAGTGEFDYELVGRFGDECQALKAYRKIGHDARVDPPEPPGERGTEIVTPP